MLNEPEELARGAIQAQLDRLRPNAFACEERKGRGESERVDLQVRMLRDGRVPLAVEVATVNRTQLLGEVLRLYLDDSPLKLLVLIKGTNVPPHGPALAERTLRQLYGQARIENTPARVVWAQEEKALEAALRDLLLL